MHSMYTTSNTNITDSRSRIMKKIIYSKNDIFILGCLHTLRSLQSVKDEGDDMNDIQWDILLETQRRNLEDPGIEECLNYANENEECQKWN